MKRILPEAFILIDDFIAAAKRTFRIEFQQLKGRRNITVFFHRSIFCPNHQGALTLICRVGTPEARHYKFRNKLQLLRALAHYIS